MEFHVRVTVPVLFLAGLSALISTIGRFFPDVLFELLGIHQIGIIMLVLSLVGFLLVPLLVIPFGYWSGSRVDVSQTYGSLIGFLLLSGGLAHLVGGLIGGIAIVFIVPHMNLEIVRIVQALVWNVPTGAIEVILAGVTGASLAQFRKTS